MEDRQVSLKQVLDALEDYIGNNTLDGYEDSRTLIGILKALPSAQPEIIRCNSCKYWTQSTGKMKGYGLGRCDFHDADLVTCNGFCYWAETGRR